MLDTLKRAVAGRPLASAEQEHQRLIKVIALAVFSSDAISSTACDRRDSSRHRRSNGSSLELGLEVLVPIAPPSRCCSRSSRRRIAKRSARTRAVAAPMSSAARTSGRTLRSLPARRCSSTTSLPSRYRSPPASPRSCRSRSSTACATTVLAWVGLILLISIVNLRGLKESGRLFAVPTYLYIVMITALVGYGLARAIFGWFGGIEPIEFDPELAKGVAETGGTLGLFLILKGFSSGAVALTGVEAISNGVPAFRRPESKNAANTLVWMAVILGSLFFGVSVLAHHLHLFPSEDVTVFAQLGGQVFGDGFLFGSYSSRLPGS